MRFNRFLHLIAFSGKAHGDPPASGLDTSKMPDAPAPSQATAKASFSRYLPLSGSGAGKGWDVLYLGRAAASALAAVRPQGAAPQDLVFQLSEVQIHRRIRDAARAAGLAGAFSGDSPRAGMAMDLAAAGFTIHDLMIAGRWSSTAMAARFTRSLAEAGGPVNRYYSRVGAALP